MQFKLATQDDIIIKNVSDEAKRISGKIKEHMKGQAPSRTTTYNSNDGNDANFDTSRILLAKKESARSRSRSRYFISKRYHHGLTTTKQRTQ